MNVYACMLTSDRCVDVIVVGQLSYSLVDLSSNLSLLWLMFALVLLGVENKEDKMLLPDPRPGAVS